MWYSFEKDCAIDGYDMMRLQGWPRDIIEGCDLSEHELKELAGEGYHLGSFASVATGFFLNPYAPWWSRAEA